MSTCQCCESSFQEPSFQKDALEQRGRTRPDYGRKNLFNWVTALLLTGWVAIVMVAAQFAGPKDMSTVPTLEVFLRTFL